MYPCIWTGMYAEFDLVAALRELHQHGWKHFEVSDEHLRQLEDAADPDGMIAAVLDVAGELGVSMPQAHALLQADVAEPDSDRRRQTIERVKRHCALSSRLGVKCVVIHPGHASGASTRAQQREVFRRNCESFAELGDAVGELGLMLCLENLMDHANHAGRRIFGTASAELMDLLDYLRHPALGLTLDTSHANVQNLDIPAVIREWGERLRALHISDNDGSGDQHRTPGSGKIEWLPICAALKETGYAGPFNLEIPGERHADRELRCMKSCFALKTVGMLLQTYA